MPKQDQLLATVEAVHAAGLDPERWPQALAAITRTIGGIAATLEAFDRRTSGLVEFYSFGLPPANEIAYLDQYSGLNPRIPALINGKPGNVVCDYTVLDERAMDRHPFYADFLAPAGYRYCIGGTLAVCAEEGALVSVQRATSQGHVGQQEIELMRLLLPHVRQAFETMRRLRMASARERGFRAALDWLPDGAALVRADGRLIYANQALQAIAGRGLTRFGDDRAASDWYYRWSLRGWRAAAKEKAYDSQSEIVGRRGDAACLGNRHRRSKDGANLSRLCPSGDRF